MHVYRGYDSSTNSWSGIALSTDYKEKVSYDANGNILKYLRNGISGINTHMDSLTYNYYSGTNRLKYVKDSVPDNIYAEMNGDVDDINNQTNTSNYTYTAIGNLKSDAKDSITGISWNVYGKITDIARSPSHALVRVSRNKINAITRLKNKSRRLISGFLLLELVFLPPVHY